MSDRNIIVALDPGHGGRDWLMRRRTGAQVGNFVEADWVLEWSHKARRDLVDAGFPTVMTRTSDEHVRFRERGQRALRAKAEIAFHVHVNASIDPEYQGVTVYTWPGNQDALAIASVFLACVPEHWRAGHRRNPIVAHAPRDEEEAWMNAPRNVMRHFPMTSILLELGFATNPTDLQMLKLGGESLIVPLVKAARFAGTLLGRQMWAD